MFLFLCVIFLQISSMSYAWNTEYERYSTPNTNIFGNYNYFKNVENHKKINNINITISTKIRNFDNYDPIPENLQYIYVKPIPKSLITNFRLNANATLKHILYDKITYDHKTLIQMLSCFNKESDAIYLKYLNNPQNYEQNKLYAEQLRQINGTISLYPDTIIEQFQPIIEKYDLRLVPGSENDIFLYKYYIKKYNIKYSNEFKKLLELKEYVYLKTDIYISEIFNEF